MFKLELLELLNNARRIVSEEELAFVKESICKLISSNVDEYEKFVTVGDFDEDTRRLLDSCSKALEGSFDGKVAEKKSNGGSDFDIIKKYYERWVSEYERNNNTATDECESIVKKIINIYVVNNFDVLSRVLGIHDSVSFDAFKNMLKNYIRVYFANRIDLYMKSSEFEDLGFFAKRKKRRQIVRLLDDIGRYQFDPQRFDEVLK